jgi:hypothetical protein
MSAKDNFNDDSFKSVLAVASLCVLNAACSSPVPSPQDDQRTNGHALEIQDGEERCFEISSGNGKDGAKNKSTTVCPFVDLRRKSDER